MQATPETSQKLSRRKILNSPIRKAKFLKSIPEFTLSMQDCCLIFCLSSQARMRAGNITLPILSALRKKTMFLSKLFAMRTLPPCSESIPLWNSTKRKQFYKKKSIRPLCKTALFCIIPPLSVSVLLQPFHEEWKFSDLVKFTEKA